MNKRPSLEDVHSLKRDQMRRPSLQVEAYCDVATSMKTQTQQPSPTMAGLFVASSSENLNQSRPPLGPNVPNKKGVTIFHSNSQKKHLNSACGNNITRTNTVSDEQLAKQLQLLRQASLVDPANQQPDQI